MKLLGTLAAAIGFLSLGTIVNAASAAQTNIAVAANFTDAAKEMAIAFKARTGHEAVLTFGSSGQLHPQITQKAPFQIFLSADAERRKKIVDYGLGVADSRFTFAIGKLVLWRKDPDRAMAESTLRSAAFLKIAVTNPESAPYGAAAIEALKALKLYDTLKARIVEGTSIAQTYQFIATGNAQIAFIAVSSRWLVPQSLYTPVRQDAVLKKGESNAAATAFMSLLRGPEARAIIEKYGYPISDNN